jgi:predicted Zn finger-like uncharacterized protein
MESYGVEHEDQGTALAGRRRALDDVSARGSTRGSTPSLSQVFGAAASPSGAPSADPQEIERVTCPSCRTEYGLPPDLLPAWGGSMRCPRCGASFSVGARAQADEIVHEIVARDPAKWRSACERQTLWTEWGDSLLEAYAVLRDRHGSHAAGRALRRALEAAAPGVPWLAPPPRSPRASGDETAEETLFDRRREC